LVLQQSNKKQINPSNDNINYQTNTNITNNLTASTKEIVNRSIANHAPIRNNISVNMKNDECSFFNEKSFNLDEENNNPFNFSFNLDKDNDFFH